MFIIAKLKLSMARKYRKGIGPESADLAANCAILIGPPKACLNSIFPVITFLSIEKVSTVYCPIFSMLRVNEPTTP